MVYKKASKKEQSVVTRVLDVDKIIISFDSKPVYMDVLKKISPKNAGVDSISVSVFKYHGVFWESGSIFMGYCEALEKGILLFSGENAKKLYQDFRVLYLNELNQEFLKHLTFETSLVVGIPLESPHTKEQIQTLFSQHVLENLCGSPPSFSTVYDKRTEKNYYRFLFNTWTFSKLNALGQAFYSYDSLTKLWVKDVPQNIAEILTPRAVAYMYMDDGSLKYYGHSNAMRICCESFSKESVELLQAAMWDNFQISLTLTKRRKNGVLIGYRLAINEAESSKFRELIQPYLVECMKYKVSDGKKGSLADK